MLLTLAVGVAGVLHQADPAPPLLAMDAKIRPTQGKTKHGKAQGGREQGREHSKAQARERSKAQAPYAETRRKHKHNVAHLRLASDAAVAAVAAKLARAAAAKAKAVAAKEQVEAEEAEAEHAKEERELAEAEADQATEEATGDVRHRKKKHNVAHLRLESDAAVAAVAAKLARAAAAKAKAVAAKEQVKAEEAEAEHAKEERELAEAEADQATEEATGDGHRDQEGPAEIEGQHAGPTLNLRTSPNSTNQEEHSSVPPSGESTASMTAQKPRAPMPQMSAIDTLLGSSPISAAFKDLVQTLGADQKKEAPSTISAVQAIRDAVTNAAASYSTASGELRLQTEASLAQLASSTMSPAARAGSLKQNEFRDLVNQVRSSNSGAPSANPSFSGIYGGGSRQTEYDDLVKPVSSVDEDAVDVTQPDASPATPPSPSSPPAQSDAMSRLKVKRVVLADLDLIPHLLAPTIVNTTSRRGISSESERHTSEQTIVPAPLSPRAESRKKQAEFRRLVARIKAGDISTAAAASSAATLFEDAESFSLAPHASKGSKARRSNGVYSFDDSSAAPESPSETAVSAAVHNADAKQPSPQDDLAVRPKEAARAKHSALAFNALVLAQRSKLSYNLPRLPLDSEARLPKRSPHSTISLLSSQSTTVMGRTKRNELTDAIKEVHQPARNYIDVESQPLLASSAADVAPLRRLYVFGLDGSGTRYVSRALSKAVDPHSTWDGEEGFCHTMRGVDINHVSLPGGRSTSKSSTQVKQGCDGQMNLVEHVDHCERVPLPTRWFANITTILASDPNSRGIIVTREKETRLHGALRTCPDKSMALAEMDFGQEQVDLALRAVPRQLLTARYEDFGSNLEGQWRRIFDWVGWYMPASLEPVEPHNSE